MKNNTAFFQCAQFSIKSVQSKKFLITASYSLEIANQDFFHFLKALNGYAGKSISHEELKQITDESALNLDELLPLLQGRLALIRAVPVNAIRKVALDIDDASWSQMLQTDLDGLADLSLVNTSSSEYGDADTLVICVRQQYDDAYFEEAINALADDQYIVTAGIVDHVFQIDNLYSRMSGLPSHFSNLYQMNQVARSGISLEDSNWLLFYRRLCHLNGAELPQLQPNQAQRGLMMFALYQFVSRIIDPFSQNRMTYDDSQFFWSVNLKTGEIVKEVSVHSPYDMTINHSLQREKQDVSELV